MLRNLLSPSSQRTPSRLSSDPLVSFRRAVDRLFDDFSTDLGSFSQEPFMAGSTMQVFHPRWDLEEKDDKIILSAELPGMEEKDIQIEVNRDYLTLRGEKKSEHEEKNGGRYFSERSYGSFERSMQLPQDVLKDKIDAQMKNGVLTVTMPKSAESKKDVKKIQIHH